MSKQPNRSPAFLFYADDFLSGTSEMSAEEVGGYIRLLCHQWAKGGLPNDEPRLGRMAGLMGSPSLGYVIAKFTLCEDGQLRHPKLEAVRSERDAFLLKQSASGKKGAEARWNDGKPNGNPIGDPNGNPIGDPNGKPIETPMANEWPKDGSPSPSPSSNTKAPPNAGAPEGLPDLPVQLPPGFPKSEASAQLASVSVGCPESFAAEEWHRAMSRGGRDSKDIPIRSWPSYLRTCWNHHNNRQAENAHRDRNTPGTGTVRNGQPSAADIRRSLVAGADQIHRDSLAKAEREREMVESGRLPI